MQLGHGRLADERHRMTPVLLVSPDTAVPRIQPGEQCRARRIAEGISAMRIREAHAAAGEPVDVRGERLRVTAEKAAPVVQIVDDDEQDVRTLRRFRLVLDHAQGLWYGRE
jgi:hypothetical protein